MTFNYKGQQSGQLPFITIIIPTYNRAQFLKQTIESALQQDYNNLEVLVCDNASIDNTSEIVAEYLNDSRFKYYKNQSNIGMVNNWKKALYEYAKGDYFVILSDDDYFIDFCYISKAIKLIMEYDNIMLVYASGYIYDVSKNNYQKLNLPFNTVEDGKTIFLSRGTVNPQDFTLCNILFNRELALRLNAFSNEYNLSCDTELFLKMCLFSNVGVIHDLVSVYRVHASNLIKQVHVNLNLLVHNLDHIIEPYKLAQAQGISERELSIYKKRLIIPSIKHLIITLLLYHKERYKEILEIVEKKDKDILLEVQNQFGMKVKMLLGKHSRQVLYSYVERRKIKNNFKNSIKSYFSKTDKL